MVQADSNITISIDSTRRGFLAQPAAAAAGDAAVGVALPMPVSAGLVPDPILGLIEAHKAARACVYSAADRYSVFERELQANGRLRPHDRLEDEQRRGEEIEAAIAQAYDAEDHAACALVSESPTTMAGVLALLTYANTADTDGEGCRPECGWNSARRILREHEVIVSGGEVNWLIDGFCGEGLPTIDLAHADLSRGEQRPEHHRGGVGRRQHGLGFDPPLELLVQPLDRICRA